MISVPSLLIYEITNLLRYKSDLSLRQVQQAVESLFDMEVIILPPSPSIMLQAIEIARTHHITIYDAAFVALAQSPPAAFVTADERLTQRLAVLSFVYYLGEVEVPV